MKPLRSVSRKYDYLKSKRPKLQEESQIVHDNTFSYPQSYSPTSPVRTRDDYNPDVENEDTVDYTQAFHYSNSIDNTQMFQYPDSSDNTQMYQSLDSIDNAQTFQNADSIGNVQTFQYAESVDNTGSIQNTENDAVFQSDNSQGVICISSSPESDYQETPLSPKYTAQSDEEYCGLKTIPGSSTMIHCSDFENPNLNTSTSSTPIMMKESTLPQGELIPIQNPEMKRLALLEAQSTPVIDPNTFGEFGMVPMINILLVFYFDDWFVIICTMVGVYWVSIMGKAVS